MTLRSRCHEVLDAATPGDRLSRLVDMGILSLILLNVAALILETLPEFRSPRFAEMFLRFEQVSLLLFSVEYVMRVWSIVDEPHYRHPITGRLRFMATPMALADLAAVLPTFLGLDTRYLRVLRLLKLARYIESMRLLQRVVVQKRAELGVTLLVIGILLIFTSCLIYFAEKDHNPQFDSIPAAMWWSIITLTTVGYGDTSPTSPAGQLIAGFIAILGIGMFALPTSILGAAFVEEMERRHRPKPDPTQPTNCPRCGKQIDTPAGTSAPTESSPQ